MVIHPREQGLVGDSQPVCDILDGRALGVLHA